MSTTGSRAERALVTGGNRGIGLEVVRQLAELGIEVVLGARDLAAGEAATASLGLPGVTAVRIDVADPASVAAARDELAPVGVDILVNNAGIYPRGDATPEDVEAAWQVNALGTWRVTQAFLPPMCERGWGRFVTVSSDAGRVGMGQGLSIYGAAKAGAVAFGRNLAHEVGKYGVTVNSVSLGMMGS
jgi:NAD(P)-dependent dehydrogenase (short-subunit alcohol dehydrogenase family)